MSCRRRARPRVVECQERRRPAECSGDGILEEAIWLIVGRDAGVGMDVDTAGEDEQARRIDRLASGLGQSAEVGPDSFNSATRHGHVGARRPFAGDDRTATNEEIGHRRQSFGSATAPAVAATSAAAIATAVTTPAVAAPSAAIMARAYVTAGITTVPVSVAMARPMRVVAPAVRPEGARADDVRTVRPAPPDGARVSP